MPLGHRAGDNSESRYCGAEVAFSSEIHVTLSCNLAGGFDFIVAPLTNPNYRPSNDCISDPSLGESVPPFSGSDLILSPSQWSSHVVGKISKWINLDSKENLIQLDSETILRKEISWASHLSLQACLLPTPKDFSCENYSRCVNQVLQNLSNMQLWLRIPLVDQEDIPMHEDNSSNVETRAINMYNPYCMFSRENLEKEC